MDYSTNPVQVSPGPQQTAAGPRGASPPGSGSQGFNGFLQSAVSTPASSVQAYNEDSGNSANGTGNAVGVGQKGTGTATDSDSASDISTSQLAASESESTDVTGKPVNGLQHSRVVTIPDASINAQNTTNVSLPVDLTGGIDSDVTDVDVLHGNLFNSVVMTGDAGTKSGTQREQQSHAAVNALSTKDAAVGELDSDVLPLNGITADAKGMLPKSSDNVSGTQMGVNTGSALLTASGATSPRATELRVTTVQSMNTASMVVEGSVDQSNTASALRANETLAKSERVLAAPLQKGVHGGQLVTDTVALTNSSKPVVTISPDAASDLRVKTIPAAVDLSSTQGNGLAVSASIATAGVAHGLVSRHRNGAANDDSVSQIARGGNEARLVELNGARAANAVAPGDAVVSTVVEMKAELDAKHTNAVTLAAIRDEKSLRATMPVTGQQQTAARIGGIDVTQIGSVDFAVAQVDVAPASQAVPRVAILEPGWTNQLGTDLRSLVARGPSTTQVQVTPAELGPLDIEVSVNRQEVSVRILAMHGQTREMLEAALPRLREVLGQSYASVDVSVGNGSGNSSSNNQSQHSGGQAGTMTMMSDGQDGLNDSTQARDSGRAEGTQAEDESSSLPADDTNTQQNVSPVADNLKPARGLVDAYA